MSRQTLRFSRGFGNIVGHAKGVGDTSSLMSWTAEQFDPRLSWGDVEWIKKRWGGKLILKGINDVEDAVQHRSRQRALCVVCPDATRKNERRAWFAGQTEFAAEGSAGAFAAFP